MYERERVLEEFALQKEFLQETALPNIEKYRKGDCVVTVCDAAGKPMPRTKVQVKQTAHAFRFGANIFMLDEMETKEKNELYKKHFAETFNMATLPFFWNATEPEEGKTRYDIGSPRMYRRPPIDLCLEFCEKHGIEPREHGLAYEEFFPEWLSGRDIPAVKKAMEKRFAEIAERYAHRIRTIEVTNEMQRQIGRTPFYDSPEYVTWCFKLAEKYFPNNELVINERTPYCWDDPCRPTDCYWAYLENSILKGARIDAVGMQFHAVSIYKGLSRRENEYDITRKRYNPREVYKHMDLYAQFGKPLQISEITFPSYSWQDEDEQIQAAALENMYTVWFSHPATEQIIYWNLVDGYAHLWRADEETIRKSLGDMTLGENYYHGGLFRHDFTPKPAFHKLKELLEKTWRTEMTLQTDENGRIRFRGFYGDYALQLAGNTGKTADFKLSSGADNRLCVTLSE